MSVDYREVTALAARLDDAAAAIRDAARGDAEIASDVPYARYYIEGTRPHDIFPRDKKALFWPSAAHPVAHVHHPGTPPHPVLTDAVEAEMPQVAQEIAVATVAVIEQSLPGAILAAFTTGVGRIVERVRSLTTGKTGRLRDSFTARWTR